jgi:Tol biopolymer transport system component
MSSPQEYPTKRRRSRGLYNAARLTFALLALSLLATGSAFSQFGKNKVQYDKFDWKVLKSEHFDIYFYEKERPMVLDAAKIAERAYTRYSKILNFKPQRRIPLILYASFADFTQTNVLPQEISEGLGGVNEFMKKRVILPFTGSWKDFEHVLTHELAHAFQIDILWGESTPVSNPFAFMPPLWFIEGMVEQLSIGEMTVNTEMWLRDAALNGYLMTLEELSYMPQGAYTFGHSFWFFIAQRYGHRKVGEILQKTSLFSSLDNAFKSSVGAEIKTLSKQWNEDIRKTYLPQIVNFQKPEDFSRQLTNHERDGSSFNTTPALNSTGETIAFTTNKSGYIDIRVASAIDGKKDRTLIGGQRNPELENLRFLYTSLDWSPDDRYLTYVGKVGPEEAVFVYNYYNEEVVHKFTTGLDGVLTPDFSPDGKKIVFSGIDGGRSNLYTIEIETGEVEQITDDRYTQRDPAWSPDGKQIAFTTEYGPGTDMDRLIFSDYRIAVLELESGEYTVMPNSFGNNISPQWSPDGSKLAYVSDRTGIANIFYHDYDQGRDYQVSDILTGISGITENSPCLSWSSGSGRLAFSAFFNTGWDIYVVNNPERMAKEWLPDTTTVFNHSTVHLNASEHRVNEIRNLLRPTNGDNTSQPGSDSPLEVEVPAEALANLSAETAEIGEEHSAEPTASPNIPAAIPDPVLADSPDAVFDPSQTPASGSVPELDRIGLGPEVTESAETEEPQEQETSERAEFTGNYVFAPGTAPVEMPAADPVSPAGEPAVVAHDDDSTAALAIADSLLPRADSLLMLRDKPDSLPVISFEFEMDRSNIPLVDTTDFEYERYKPRFSIDYVSGYGGYMGNIGASGGVFLSISDQLGNHNIAMGANIYGKIQDSDLFFQYTNLEGRTDKSIFVSQFRDLYYYGGSRNSSEFLANIWRGAGLRFSRPFNKFRRFEYGAAAYMVSQKAIGISFDPYYSYYPPQERTLEEYGTSYFAGPQAALVFDNTAYGMTGPVDGSRYRLSAQQYFGELSYTEVMADWRKYWLLWRRVTVAVRGVAGTRFGNDPRLFYLGGPYTFRGAWYADMSGHSIMFTNAEIRFPFIDFLAMGWPLPIVLRGIGGVLFFDMASAWLDNEAFQPFTGTNAKWFKLKDAQAAWGFGIRTNLGYMVLRFDMSHTLDHYDTNFYQTPQGLYKTEELVKGRRRNFFSIGYDY